MATFIQPIKRSFIDINIEMDVKNQPPKTGVTVWTAQHATKQNVIDFFNQYTIEATISLTITKSWSHSNREEVIFDYPFATRGYLTPKSTLEFLQEVNSDSTKESLALALKNVNIVSQENHNPS